MLPCYHLLSATCIHHFTNAIHRADPHFLTHGPSGELIRLLHTSQPHLVAGARKLLSTCLKQR
jgi:hypothetical protein